MTMKKLFAALLIILLGAAVALATDPANYARDYEEITVSTTAVGLTAAKVAKLNPALSKSGAPKAFAWVFTEGANIRFRIDSTSPTATVGAMLYTGKQLRIDDYYDALNLRMIRDTAATGDATVRVIYKAIR